MRNEFEDEERSNTERRLRELVEEYIEENPQVSTLDKVDREQVDIGILTPKSTNTQIINKVNEIAVLLNKVGLWSE